jgi:predicted CXXCH cytochrome family protein
MRDSGFMRRPLVIMLIPLAVAAACWVGCSVEKDYKILSFFFEGVPTPEELAAQRAGGPDLASAGKYVIHDPYDRDACLECHPSPTDMQLTRADSQGCRKCHESVLTQYAVMHGPVVGEECLWCHNPHMSVNEHLLRQRPPELCMQCHDEGLMSSQLPAHEDPDRDCLACHQGHGGPTRGFLRPSYNEKEAGGVAVAPDGTGGS